MQNTQTTTTTNSINLAVTLQFAESIAGDYWSLWHKGGLKPILAIFLLLTVGYGYTLFDRSFTSWQTPVFLVLLPFFSLLVFLTLGRMSAHWRMFRKLPESERSIAYRFSANGFEARSGDALGEYLWETIKYGTETPHLFVLVHHNLSYRIMPKRCFADNHQLILFKEMLKTALGTKLTLR